MHAAGEQPKATNDLWKVVDGPRLITQPQIQLSVFHLSRQKVKPRSDGSADVKHKPK